jgi:REP element-mobilizing transposase RayT
MNRHPEPHHRRSIRLRGFDYSQPGAYFVTIVTHDRACLFGEVAAGELRLNEWGRIVADTWVSLASRFAGVVLDGWILMPNHLHGILVIDHGVRRGGSRTAPTIPAKQKPLGGLIGAFKTISTKHINELRGTPGVSVWQRNYYEHIIRDGDGLDRIRNYIAENPLRWEFDRENPLAPSADTARARPDKPWLV